jgi:hypothetical protein
MLDSGEALVCLEELEEVVVVKLAKGRQQTLWQGAHRVKWEIAAAILWGLVGVDPGLGLVKLLPDFLWSGPRVILGLVLDFLRWLGRGLKLWGVFSLEENTWEPIGRMVAVVG